MVVTLKIAHVNMFFLYKPSVWGYPPSCSPFFSVSQIPTQSRNRSCKRHSQRRFLPRASWFRASLRYTALQARDFLKKRDHEI